MTCEQVLIINQGRMVAFDEIRNLAHALGQARPDLARGHLHQAHRRRLTPQGSTTRMRNALAIARKELSHLLHHPVGLRGLHRDARHLLLLLREPPGQTFKEVQELARVYGWARLPPDYGQFKNLTDGVVVQLWGVIGVITLFVAPFLSMRLFAEEKRHRTFELLMTAPVRPCGDRARASTSAALGVIWRHARR